MYIQGIQKVFRPLEFSHILLRYSLILKWITPPVCVCAVREEWEKLRYRCAKLVATYPKRLKAVVAAKGASTKY